MNEDVMAEYKSSRFVVVDPDLGFGTRTIVLSDIGFWTEHVDQLHRWCLTNCATQKGMTVELSSDETLTLFILKWS